MHTRDATPPSGGWVRRGGAVLAALLAASTVVQAPGSPVGAAAPPPLPAANSHGITLRSWNQVDPAEPANVPRLLEATVTTDAMFKPGTNPSINPTRVPIKVRILLPANYSTNPSRAYRTLYLLHGGGDDWAQWSNPDEGNIEAIVAASPFRGIVVMPEAGYAGWYSDWAGQTNGRFRPLRETFHVRQLVRWIDANFNTVERRSGRAVAGISMGGYGSLRYSARFSSTFGAVAALSPGTDIRDASAQDTISQSMWFLGAAVAEHGRFDLNYRVFPPFWQWFDAKAYHLRTVFGDPAGWHRYSPIDLAGANAYAPYDGRLALYTGTTGTDARHEPWTDALHARLDERSVDHRYCKGTGEHSWDHWRNDIADFLRYAYGGAPATSSCPNNWGPPVD